MVQVPIDRQRLEALGPAERIIQTLTTFTDHMVHNRPGFVVPDARANGGVRWDQATLTKAEGQPTQVFRVSKVGNKTAKTPVGVLAADGKTVNDATGRKVGEYRKPGIFPEMATWLYGQVAEAYRLDQEFVARWASWTWAKDHKDMKVVLAAFLLVQSRCGEPVRENGEVIFFDDDYRAVGEAMLLLTGATFLDTKLIRRIGQLLVLPGVAEINRKLGFGKSARNPTLGRYDKAVHKWIRFRERNPKMLEGLVKKGFGSTVRDLVSTTHYKADSPTFYRTLRWKQKQAPDGRRTMAIGVEVDKAESWVGLTEREICERISKAKFGWKRIVGLLPAPLPEEEEGKPTVPDLASDGYRGGLTKAIMAAAIEAGCLSDADIVILSPTIEELGLLAVPAFRTRWEEATAKATNQRAANIARNLKVQSNVEVLKDAADAAAAKVMAEVTKDLQIMVIVDKSGSMQGSLEKAKEILPKLLVSFPLERLHISVFNSVGTEITLKVAKAAAVEHAFKGHSAGGATSYADGVKVLSHHKPKAGEDVLPIFIGDQGDPGDHKLVQAIKDAGWNPVALGLISIVAAGWGEGTIVRDAARLLGVPCLTIDPALFNDPYTVTRTLRNLIATTPVGKAAPNAPAPKRVTLVEEIMKTPLLERPMWAA